MLGAVSRPDGGRRVIPVRVLLLAGVILTALAAANQAYAPGSGPVSQNRPPIQTHLYALERAAIYMQPFAALGGAIASLGDNLLVVTPRGRIALIDATGGVAYLDGRVPMNELQLETHEINDNPTFNSARFRVADILLQENAPDNFALFVSHHYFTGDCMRFRLSATVLRRDGAQYRIAPSWRTVFDAEPCLGFELPNNPFGGHQAGGRMLPDGPEHLLVIIGDHGRDGLGGRAPAPILPVSPDSHLGKLVRINIATGAAEILTMGHRNPQGLARDRDGNLWATEHGPAAGDELNLLEPGGHYGWPYASYGIYNRGRVIAHIPETEFWRAGGHDGYARPAFAWVPAIAPSNLIVNDPQSFPLWKDDLLIATLKGNAIFRVRRHGRQVQYVERIAIGYRIRDIASMPDGRIALLMDESQVHFLSRSTRYCTQDARQWRNIYSVLCESYTDTDAAADDGATAMPGTPGAGRATEPARTAIPDAAGHPGRQLFNLRCSVCHNLNVAEHQVGPHLADVVGRRAGSVDGYRFSAALESLQLTWTKDALEQFLANPQEFAPGSAMSAGVSKDEAGVIADYLDRIQADADH